MTANTVLLEHTDGVATLTLDRPPRNLLNIELLESLNDTLRRYVERLAAPSGPVLQLAKRAQLEAYYSTYEEALYKVENLYLRELMALRDPAEGIRAHLEGRAPRWVNG